MKIIVYCGSGGPSEWNGRSVNDGIGGSEESLIYCSRELAALGHGVTIFNNALQEREIIDGVLWARHNKFDIHESDIFIGWRDFRLMERGIHAKKKYLIEQDQPVFPHFSPEAKAMVDRGEFKMILLNEHHRNQYGVTPEQAFVCSNGCKVSQFEQSVERIPGKCIYLSHPSRGLLQLREYWPKIRAAVPHAELHAFWWQDEVFLPPNESIGIMPMRKLGHMELAREILSADLFCYPSIFTPEISPVSCIKAQCGGAWPVTVNAGGMGDTLISGTFTDHAHFADEVIAELTKRAPMESQMSRLALMNSAREKFNWKNIAAKWQDEFLTELAK